MSLFWDGDLSKLQSEDIKDELLILNAPAAMFYSVQILFKKRLESAKSYNDFLVFCCDIGRLDIVQYTRDIVDKDNNVLQEYIQKKPNISRIFNFSDIQDINRLQHLAMKEISEKDTTLLKDHFFLFMKDMRKSKDATFIDNMILNFSLFLLLRTRQPLFTKSECIDIIEYFKNAEKTEQLRRNGVYLLLFDYVIKHNFDDFFVLHKRDFDHLTYVQYALSSTSFLSSGLKNNLFYIFKEKIKCANQLTIKKKLKFAVCISGLYRNHRDSLESIKENLIKPLEADVFIHTWDKMAYWSGYGGSPSSWRTFGVEAQQTLPKKYQDNLMRLRGLLPHSTEILKTPLIRETNISEIKEILNPKSMIIESELDFISSLSKPSGFTRRRGTFNQIKMFWGIKKAIDLALNYDKYDVIIRIRPDMKVVNPVTPDFFEKIESNVLYSRAWPTTGFSDSVFYFTDNVAYTLSRFVDQMIDRQELSPFDNYPEYDAHLLLALWIYSSNILLNSKYIEGFLYTNPVIKLDGLSEALSNDLLSLDNKDKEDLQKFISYLRNNHC